MRPRSWCSWESPYRSAFSITMMTALGTSTPTSTTVVETRSWVSPREKEVITRSFSAGFILPWSTPTEAWGKAFFYQRGVLGYALHAALVLFDQGADEVALAALVQVFCT